MSNKERLELDIDGRKVSVSTLDRVLWPRVGFTKRMMIDYYLAAAPALLPHIRGRALTLKRAPEGIDEHWWYQTECPHPPAWLETIPLPRAGGDGEWNFCSANDRGALTWLANIGCIEIHPLLFRGTRMDAADTVVFDLDPGDGVGLVECCRVALSVRDALDDRSINSFVKTSGAGGMHVIAPFTASFERTRELAFTIAGELADEHPALVATKKTRRNRDDKVLIDWDQNGPYRSLVAAYSLRALALPFVSAPVTWDEVTAVVEAEDASSLLMLPQDVLARLEEGIDPFAELIAVRERSPL